MPNHVTNVLRVSGDTENVREMFEAIKDDKLIHPTEKEIEAFQQNSQDGGMTMT